MPLADMSMTDAFFPGGDEPTSNVAKTESPAPAKARRGRTPKGQPNSEPVAFLGQGTKATTAPAQSVASFDDDVRATHTAATPRTMRRSRQGQPNAPSSVDVADAASSSAAARWDAETDIATFNWPTIEAVAAIGGANQAMAKLLLAARAEGANSRWPF